MAIEIGFAVGSLILVLAIIYGIVQASRRNKANDPLRDAAVKEQYANPARYEAKTENEFKDKVRPS